MSGEERRKVQVFKELERTGVGSPEGYASVFDMERFVRLMVRVFPETTFMATHSCAEWFSYHGQNRLDAEKIERLRAAGRMSGKDLDLWLPVYVANEKLWERIHEVFDYKGFSPDSRVELDREGKVVFVAGTICISPEFGDLPTGVASSEVVRLLADWANDNERGCAATRRTSFGESMLIVGRDAERYAESRRDSPYPFAEIVPIVTKVDGEPDIESCLEAALRRAGYAPGAYRSVVFMHSPVTGKPEIFAKYIHDLVLPEILDIPEELVTSETASLNWLRIQCKVFLSLLLIKGVGSVLIENEFQKLKTVFRVHESRYGEVGKSSGRLAEKIRKVRGDIGVVSPEHANWIGASE